MAGLTAWNVVGGEERSPAPAQRARDRRQCHHRMLLPVSALTIEALPKTNPKRQIAALGLTVVPKPQLN